MKSKPNCQIGIFGDGTGNNGYIVDSKMVKKLMGLGLKGGCMLLMKYLVKFTSLELELMD